MLAWTSAAHIPKAEREAAREIVLGCCLLHGWIMNEHLRCAEQVRSPGPRLHLIALELHLVALDCAGCAARPCTAQSAAPAVHRGCTGAHGRFA